MKIIGIKVLNGMGHAKSAPEVMKGLKPGWFPLGNYVRPSRKNGRWFPEYSPEKSRLYNVLFEELPKISVCGIVGKNGSGKSTLIDYLMMIINNAASILLNDQYAESEEKPTMALGLYGELYYEAERRIYRLKCSSDKVLLSDGGQDKDLREMGNNEKERLKSHLSFMVLINYGLYSLNPNDYDVMHKKSEVSGDWLRQLFSIEQNNIFPITITPQRRDSIIDINEHQRTEKEKLVALMILAEVKGNKFMDGYSPVEMPYTFNKSLTTELLNRLSRMANDELVGVDYLIGVKSAILEGWTKRLDCTELWTKDPEENERDEKEVFDAILEYMACQTVILCSYYEKFRSIFDFLAKVRENEIIHGVLLSNTNDMPEIMESHLFDAIMEDETTMSLGIRRCLGTIRETKRVGLTREPFLKKEGILSLDNFTYAYILEAVLFLLPPPVYNLDVVLRKDSTEAEMTFSKLSSGEKQQLLSMASALFHVKSVEESIARHKGFGYKDVCLVFDEAELYFHPDYQRAFLFRMLKFLSWLELNGSGWFENIQIIIATHSPFILSDIPQENILFLKDGKNYQEELGLMEKREFKRKNTFGANYYDMLRNGFFLEDNAIGMYASEVIRRIIGVYHIEDKHKRRGEYQRYAELFTGISTIIGDEYLRSVLMRMTDEMNKECGRYD